MLRGETGREADAFRDKEGVASWGKTHAACLFALCAVSTGSTVSSAPVLAATSLCSNRGVL